MTFLCFEANFTFKHFGHLGLVRFKLERRQETQGAQVEGHHRRNTALERTKEGKKERLILTELTSFSGKKRFLKVFKIFSTKSFVKVEKKMYIFLKF